MAEQLSLFDYANVEDVNEPKPAVKWTFDQILELYNATITKDFGIMFYPLSADKFLIDLERAMNGRNS